MRALREQRAGTAVRLLMASGDEAALATAAGALLEQFAASERSADEREQDTSARRARVEHVDAVLDAAGDTLLFSGPLAMLSDYRRLHVLMRDQHYAYDRCLLLAMRALAQHYSANTPRWPCACWTPTRCRCVSGCR